MNATPPAGALPAQQIAQLPMTPEMVAGSYANGYNLWHTGDTMVMDFTVTAQPAVQQMLPGGQPVAIHPTHVVSRVRIPVPMVIELMKGLGTQLTAWETETGQAKPPVTE